MMTPTGNKAHDANVQAAERVRQAALVPGATQAQVNSAHVTFHRMVIASALANGVSVQPHREALQELGQGGSFTVTLADGTVVTAA